MDLVTAFTKSCNITFGKLAYQLGVERLRATAENFGFNENFKFGDFMIYNSVFPESVENAGGLVWAGVGQGEVLATPQHMAMIAGAVANGGVMMKPVLVKRIENSMGASTHTMETSVYRQAMQPATAELLARAMYETVQSGTASRAAISGYTVCGKTGSAETSDDKSVPTNAWFVGFIRDESKPYAVAVVVEQGGAGSTVATPIARQRWKRPSRSWDRGKRVRSEEFALKLKNLPDSPGCYLMKSHGQIIYVGKAVNLKNRVRQYFQSSKNHTPKVQAMVERVDDFDIVLVDSEMEALALELNLIKRYRPKYNILLKDDKHFPYIRVDLAQDYPRLELVRKQARDGARYFGPYKGATAVREVLDVARMVFPIRTCNRVIRPEKPQRPCVHHEIGQCLAPCAGLTTPGEYHAVLARAMEFLSGKDGPVLAELKERMAEAAKAMNYERAAVYRDRIRAVEDVMQRQKAISTHASDQDVIAVVPEESDAIIQMLFIRSGRLIGSEHYVLEGGGSELPGEVILQFILQYYDAENMPPQELLLSAEPPERDVLEQLLSELHGRRTYILTPLRGEKRKLVAMAQKNRPRRGRKSAAKSSPAAASAPWARRRNCSARWALPPTRAASRATTSPTRRARSPWPPWW